MSAVRRLTWEKEIYQLEDVLAQLEARSDGQADRAEEVRRMRRNLANLKRTVYSNLTAWQTVEVARHPDRPQTLDYLDLIFEEFVELARRPRHRR